MTPEEKARVLIDQMFTDAGWKVVSRDEYSIWKCHFRPRDCTTTEALCKGVWTGPEGGVPALVSPSFCQELPGEIQ